MQKQELKPLKKVWKICKMNPLKKIYFIRILLLAGCFSFCQQIAAQNWDIDLLKNINPQNPNSVVMKGFSSSVYPIAVAAPVSLVIAGFIEKDKQLKNKGWELAGSLAINTIVTQGAKRIINRQRPYTTYPNQVFAESIETDPSFPSGHTSTAFATATTLSLEFKKWYVVIPAYVWAAGVGYSRIYLGKHYPTDVIAGAVVGAGSAILSRWLTKQLLNNKQSYK